MEGLALTKRPAFARARSLDAELIARVAFGLLCLAFAIGFFVYPTYPNYDSYYSLLWGQDILHLRQPDFEGFRVPTGESGDAQEAAPLTLAALEAVNDVPGPVFHGEVRRGLANRLYRDDAITREFRLAMLHLCLAQLDPADDPDLAREGFTASHRLSASIASEI